MHLQGSVNMTVLGLKYMKLEYGTTKCTFKLYNLNFRYNLLKKYNAQNLIE